MSHEGEDSEKRIPGWPSVTAGAFAAVGVAWAAAFATTRGVERDVGIAAWVAAAVVGASATISAAVGPPRPLRRRSEQAASAAPMEESDK